ncbi:MAG: tetratricopeptide repeat protein [Bacteroidota bacterium]|nr:tetratricopeptide repeat protein [Bacteroidota bacterium]
MKKTLLLLLISCATTMLLAQDKNTAEKYVNEGIILHDKGDYEAAIAKYDQALEFDKNNLVALSEKALTCFSLQKYDESIRCCKKVIELYPENKNIVSVYVTYGNVLDATEKTDISIEIYNEGIKLFPDNYQLYFNKGVTLSGMKEYDEAIKAFQKAISINPKHASSHNAIARILNVKKKRIPSLLAFCRFMVLEPGSSRGIDNLESIKKLINSSAQKTGNNSITISITPDMLSDTSANGKPKENSFTSTDLILAIEAGLDFDKSNKKKTEVQLFISKIELVCSSLKETKKDNYGFYWDYYVPYFLEMKEQDMIETFGYIAFSSSNDKKVKKWIKSHQDEIAKFFAWSKAYTWKAE